MPCNPELRCLCQTFLQEERRALVNKTSRLTSKKTQEIMEEITNMTAERSLEIIRESIERSQRTINKNSALPLIWWGACVVAFSLLIAYLWNNHGGPVWNF